MIIQPKVKGFICTTAHPKGCAENVKRQITYVKNHPAMEGAKNVLVIGCSTGYGLASRISLAYGAKANTLGIMFEKQPTERRCATAGYYNTKAFDEIAASDGLYAKTINGDAFSEEIKKQTIETIITKTKLVRFTMFNFFDDTFFNTSMSSKKALYTPLLARPNTNSIASSIL